MDHAYRKRQKQPLKFCIQFAQVCMWEIYIQYQTTLVIHCDHIPEILTDILTETLHTKHFPVIFKIISKYFEFVD